MDVQIGTGGVEAVGGEGSGDAARRCVQRGALAVEEGGVNGAAGGADVCLVCAVRETSGEERDEGSDGAGARCDAESGGFGSGGRGVLRLDVDVDGTGAAGDGK